MASGDKPAIKIAIKIADEGATTGTVSLGAAWLRGDGTLGGSWDKRITRVAILLDDGTKLDIKRGADGKMPFYFNVYDNREASGGDFKAAPSKGGGYGAAKADGYAGRGGNDDPGADFGEDNLPF